MNIKIFISLRADKTKQEEIYLVCKYWLLKVLCYAFEVSR